MNFLALLGWSYDDKTTIMRPQELVERFSLDRVGPSPATFDNAKHDWMNGVYQRELEPGDYAARLVANIREQGIDWPDDRVRATVPLVQVKLEKLSQYPDYVRFLFEPVSPDGADPVICRAAAVALSDVDPWQAALIEDALRSMTEELGLRPREAFAPIRLAITGATVSPGLFESLELLGRDESLGRLAAAYGR